MILDITMIGDAQIFPPNLLEESEYKLSLPRKERQKKKRKSFYRLSYRFTYRYKTKTL